MIEQALKDGIACSTMSESNISTLATEEDSDGDNSNSSDGSNTD